MNVRHAAAKLALLAAIAAVLVGCASSSPTGPATTPGRVDLTEARRVVGTENDVRLDASVLGEKLSSNTALPITYDITNLRATPIAVADLVPMTDYDAESGTVTITLGTEVPGAELLPRLISIAAGEKKSFTTVAHVSIATATSAVTPLTRFPNAVQLKLNFLNETAPFQQLIGIAERGVHDAKLANELFPKWVERNEIVLTNTLPMRWSNDGAQDLEQERRAIMSPSPRRP